jgi:hypothetical protein
MQSASFEILIKSCDSSRASANRERELYAGIVWTSPTRTSRSASANSQLAGYGCRGVHGALGVLVFSQVLRADDGTVLGLSDFDSLDQSENLVRRRRRSKLPVRDQLRCATLSPVKRPRLRNYLPDWCAVIDPQTLLTWKFKAT